MPLITIITINLNNLSGLKKTVQSVLGQSFRDFEYIVIDGGSKDGSKDYLKGKNKDIDYWVSESDMGPYYAMNKGIDFATGRYYLFLNSGDFLYNSTVLESFNNCNPSEDLIYGNSVLIDNNQKSIKKMPLVNNLGKSLINTINHQTIFFKHKVFENNNRYDCSYKIIADWVFINELFREYNISVRKIELIIPCYDMNGISSNIIQRKKEREYYLKKNFNSDFIKLLHSYKSLQFEINDFKEKWLIRIFLACKRILNNITF